MNQNDCGCKAKGRLLLYVQSEVAQEVKVTLQEENMYKDVYIVKIENGRGSVRVDRIAMGMLTIHCDLDKDSTTYYPGRKILFDKKNYVHKLTIIDRRKMNEMW